MSDPLPAVTSPQPLFTGAFFRLWSFTFITFFCAFQLFPTIPFRVMALGGSTAAGGRFLAIYTISCAIAAPITGAIADHFGRRRMLVLASVAFLIFSALYAVTTILPLLLICACLHGFCWSALMSASPAIMSDIIPESRRTEGIAYWGMASTIAISIAPYIGLATYRHGWNAVCALMVVLSVVMLVLALRVHDHAGRRSGPFPPLREILEWKAMVAATTLLLISYSYGGITSYVAVMCARKGIEPRSIFFSVFAVTILAIRVLTSPLADRFGPRRILVPSLLVVPFGLALLARSETRWDVIFSAVVFGAGFGAAYPAFVTWMLAKTNPLRRCATFGGVIFAFDIGIGMGSLFTGLLVQQYGFAAGFYVSAAVSALSVPLFFLLSGTILRTR